LHIHRIYNRSSLVVESTLLRGLGLMQKQVAAATLQTTVHWLLVYSLIDNTSANSTYSPTSNPSCNTHCSQRAGPLV
ncbi:MAG: hypothetical protein ACKESC_01095, partial [Candidatus Hodgkinia cicadicola]